MNPNRQIQTLRGILTTKDQFNAAVQKAHAEAQTALLQLLEAAMKPDEGTLTADILAYTRTPAPSADKQE